VLVVVALILYIKSSAGSSFAITSRIYKVTSGQADFHNNEISKFNKDQQDIEHFNTVFKVKAASTQEINDYITWINKHSIDTKKLASLKIYFDISKLSVECVSKWYIAFVSLVFLVLVIGSVFLLNVITSDSALISFKDNDSNWIWLNDRQARDFTLGKSDWVIDKKICESEQFNAISLAKKSELSQTSIKSICEFFETGGGLEHIQSIIDEQKSLLNFVILFVILIVSNGFQLRLFYRTIIARNHIQRRKDT
jgi:hypothetical protein